MPPSCTHGGSAIMPRMRAAGEVAVQVVGHVDARRRGRRRACGSTRSAWLLKCEMWTRARRASRPMRKTSSIDAAHALRVVAAHVRDVDAAERRDLPAQGDQLLRRRRSGWGCSRARSTGRPPPAPSPRAPAGACGCSSSAVGGRVSRPITSMRTLPLGTRQATLTAQRRSKQARYSAMLDHAAVRRRQPLAPPLKPAV